MNKPLIIAVAVVAIATAGYIIALNIKLSVTKAENLELIADMAVKDGQIAEANAAINGQNYLIESMKADTVNAAASIQTEYDRLNKKYELLKKKAAADLGEAPDCTAQLKAIYDAQEAFCYEK